jgi:probable HAF family extracellular repeat protein
MSTLLLRLGLATIAALGAWVSAWSAPPTYRIVDLGVPEGYESSSARNFNDKGQVLGMLFHSSPPPAYRSYFLWSPELGMTIWDGAGQHTAPNPFGLNDRGKVVGMVQHERRPVSEAFVATKGGLRKLGQLEPGGSSVATSINDAGVIVGQATVGERFHAFRWTPEGGMVDLNPEGAEESYAPDINAEGAIAAWYKIRRDDLDYDGLYIAADGTATRLDCVVPDERGHTCLALGINNLDQVVGYSSFIEDVDGQRVVRYHPFVWSPTAGSTDLTAGTPFADRLAHAGSINDRGQVVGSMQSPTGRNPTYWDPVEGWHDMVELIDPADPLLPRLSFGDPFPRINRWGHVLVTGRIDGIEHALLLLPLR